MRMSCNGCRVLRKGCSENCTIRPCLQWIKNPDSQANATLFLAKFYGRTGLMNLINAGPDHLRAAIFRSLLYEACGRMVNPIYGSVGILCSGSWHLCQQAVDSVLKGAPIVPFPAYDIRHGAADLYKVSKSRTRFKHAAAGSTPIPKTRTSPASPESSSRRWCYPARSHDSSDLHSPETSHVSQAESKHFDQPEVALELTLGHDLPGRHFGFCDTTFPAYPAADDCDAGLQQL